MKKYEDGGSTRKARLEGRATKKMGKAQRTYKEAEATLSEAKSSRNPMDYADADQLYSRSARQGERAKKLKAKAAMMKKGGSIKPLDKAQDGKIIKSKKVRTADMNTFGPSTTSVSKTKGDGSTVTKSIKTNQGYVPTASMTKTVTDKSGKSTTTEKDINWNKALKKQARVVKNVGRNSDDQMSGDNYKKGGSVKKMKTGGMVNANSKVSALKVAGSKGVKSGVNPKAAASKVAKGRSGGTSAAPKTAVPKAKYGMGITKMKKK